MATTKKNDTESSTSKPIESTKAKTVKKSTSAKTTVKKPAASTSKKTKVKETITEPEELTYPFIGRFEKVSYEIFRSSTLKLYGIDEAAVTDDAESAIKDMYDQIQIPTRLSKGSPEYHFVFPYTSMDIAPGHIAYVPSGIKCYMAKNWMLKIYPEEFYQDAIAVGLHLADSATIIGSDNVLLDDNQIYIKLINNNPLNSVITIDTYSKYAKGIFEMYGIAHNELE